MKVNHRNRYCAAFKRWYRLVVSCGRLKPIVISYPGAKPPASKQKRTPSEDAGRDIRLHRGKIRDLRGVDNEDLCRKHIL